MPLQFYVSPDQSVSQVSGSLNLGDKIALGDAVAHHAATVMRIKAGGTLACFDGLGQRFTLTIDSISKRSLVARVTHLAEPEQRPEHKTHLVLSILKGQAMDRAVQSATELGASSITLVSADRSNVKLSSDRLAKKHGHWHRIVIGACEQCGRSYLPSLEVVSSWQAFFEGHSPRPTYCLDMAAPRITRAHLEKNTANDTEVTLLIGPEGGWSEDERRLFGAQQIQSVRVAANVLRAETAPVVALALVEHIRLVN